MATMTDEVTEAWDRSYAFKLANAHVGGHLPKWLCVWVDEGASLREIKDRIEACGYSVGLATVHRWVKPLRG